MNRIVLLIVLIFCFLVGNSTTVPPPGVNYRLFNNTNDSIRKVIQIQSDSQDFHVYDTFALDSFINYDEFRLFYTRGNRIKKYQKISIELTDTVLNSEPFEFQDNEISFNAIVNRNELILEKTNYFKLRRIFYHLLFIIPIFLFLKFLVILLPADFQMKLIIKEFLLINVPYPILFYFSLDYFSSSDYFLFSILVLIVLTFTIESFIYNRKLKTLKRKGITIRVLIANILSVLIGGTIAMFALIFGH